MRGKRTAVKLAAVIVVLVMTAVTGGKAKAAFAGSEIEMAADDGGQAVGNEDEADTDAADTDAGSAVEENADDGELLVAITQKALQNQEVLKSVLLDTKEHDQKVGEAVKGDYEVLPEAIIPWNISQNQVVSVVRFKASRGNREKRYTFAFVFSQEGLETVLLYPGASNTDPALFQDFFAVALGQAQSVLNSKDVNIKDTKMVGEITPSGWDEEWLWVNEKGKTYSMRVTFSTGASGEGGTVWNIKGAKS